MRQLQTSIACTPSIVCIALQAQEPAHCSLAVQHATANLAAIGTGIGLELTARDTLGCCDGSYANFPVWSGLRGPRAAGLVVLVHLELRGQWQAQDILS